MPPDTLVEFTLLADAVDRTFTEVNEGGAETPDPPRIPTKDDIYNTLIIPSIAGDSCHHCLRGAAGTYGFEGPGANYQWAVCKPVPLVEHPAREDDDAGRLPAYRTYRTDGDERCP